MLFEHGDALFVGEDGALELAERGGFGGRDFHLAHDVFALIVENAAVGGDLGVIAGEVEVDIHRIGSFIDDVTGRNGDVEAGMPAACGPKVDGIDARLVVELQGIGASHAVRTSRSGPA